MATESKCSICYYPGKHIKICPNREVTKKEKEKLINKSAQRLFESFNISEDELIKKIHQDEE